MIIIQNVVPKAYTFSIGIIRFSLIIKPLTMASYAVQHLHASIYCTPFQVHQLREASCSYIKMGNAENPYYVSLFS